MSGRVRRAAAFGLIWAAVLALSGEVAAAQADTLTPRFSVAGGRGWTNQRLVTVGDRGWSPFFTPGVVVWDGGSIIGGLGASPGMEYPAQTLRLVPHPVSSFVSWSVAAKIGAMLAEAPLEVDARHRADGDGNVCVVMGGARDLVDGRTPAAVHDDLVTYCLGRQAAGFRVVVLTLLPRRKAGFEADRQAFNALVREEWPGYADGLADVAADGRIGDAEDAWDLRYFEPGGLHPNDAGYAVMAVVTAPVLNALPWRSSDCAVRFRNGETEWTDWRPYVARSSWLLESGDGTKTVEVEYRDAVGTTVAASDSIGLDTVRPVTKAPAAARARRGRLVTLRYRVVDPEPCGARARTVTIKVRDAAGNIVKRISLKNRPVNATLGASFTMPSTWRAGRYSFRVYAVDAAGNAQAAVGRNWLTVR
jgi:hypothetical protein